MTVRTLKRHKRRAPAPGVGRDVRTGSLGAHALRPIVQASAFADVADLCAAGDGEEAAQEFGFGVAGDAIRRQLDIPDREPRHFDPLAHRLVFSDAFGPGEEGAGPAGEW